MGSWIKAEIKDNTGLFIRIRSSLQLTDPVATPLNYGNEQMYSVGHPCLAQKGAISQGM